MRQYRFASNRPPTDKIVVSNSLHLEYVFPDLYNPWSDELFDGKIVKEYKNDNLRIVHEFEFGLLVSITYESTIAAKS